MKALGHIHGVVERRNTIPILSNVLLDAKSNMMSLTATDMDISEVEEVECKVEQEGAVTTPVHMLHEIVRKLPDGSKVELNTGETKGRIELRSGRSSFTLMCLPSEDFPSLESKDFQTKFELSVEEFRRLIDKTAFAMSSEETRYYLNGIYLHTLKKDEQTFLRAVATDGHRLSRVETILPNEADELEGIILPRKTVTEVRKLTEDKTGNVSVQISNTRIQFNLGGVVLTSKLLDGTFPDYNRVIPDGNNKKLTIETNLFSEAVDRVSIVSNDRSRAVKLALKQDALIVSADSPEQGSANEEITAEYNGEAIDIGFNSKYVLDVARQIEGGKTELLLADSVSPTILTDVDDPRVLYVLMPMRV